MREHKLIKQATLVSQKKHTKTMTHPSKKRVFFFHPIVLFPPFSTFLTSHLGACVCRSERMSATDVPPLRLSSSTSLRPALQRNYATDPARLETAPQPISHPLPQPSHAPSSHTTGRASLGPGSLPSPRRPATVANTPSPHPPDTTRLPSPQSSTSPPFPSPLFFQHFLFPKPSTALWMQRALEAKRRNAERAAVSGSLSARTAPAPAPPRSGTAPLTRPHPVERPRPSAAATTDAS